MRHNTVSMRKMDNPYNNERLPPELFYAFVIPYLFAGYLHKAIVYDKVQSWNPFAALPLVSKEFHKSCQTHVRRIFDIDPQDDHPIDLIQIYICAGYAKYFYTVDVLNWLCLDRLWITGWTEDTDQGQLGGDPSIGIPKNFRFRPYIMGDDRVHRVFLPFTCAMKLCDSIQDEILAGPIADYLAKKAVTYGTEPILLKHVQDLEMNMARKYGLPIELWSKWTKDTLRLIDDRHEFLCSVQESGKLVSQYRRSSEVTKRTIKNTRLLSVLKVVSSVDWGNDTVDIQEFATVILEDLIAVCQSKGSEPEEHDEYFEHDGKKVLFSQIERIPVPSSWLF
ncbi:hypothetical protein Clacol_008809 [Clathrus columnatus]|uniref:Uncharacterized protein n=1 Tax=Clathrus columnatus TaxID=1419009 RepID=A0AAV5APC7_9AGAM|nr:hypothetical protein Clacol_008809 [Clathrus columnatus]